LKADYSWGQRGERVVENLAEARSFIRLVGAPPSLALAMKQIVVNADRAALGEWLHAKQPGLSAQRPVMGSRAMMAVACWRGEVLATIAGQVISPSGRSGSPAVIHLLENAEMDQTARRIADRLGLSGFHGFNFAYDGENGKAALTDFNSYCVGLSHLNSGPGHDLVAAFLQKWLGRSAMAPRIAHTDSLVACFPRAWAVDAADPLLKTGAYDVPNEDPGLVERAMQLVRRDQRYCAIKRRAAAMMGMGPRD
jgi:hypothetical protein